MWSSVLFSEPSTSTIHDENRLVTLKSLMGVERMSLIHKHVLLLLLFWPSRILIFLTDHFRSFRSWSTYLPRSTNRTFPQSWACDDNSLCVDFLSSSFCSPETEGFFSLHLKCYLLSWRVLRSILILFCVGFKYSLRTDWGGYGFFVVTFF